MSVFRKKLHLTMVICLSVVLVLAGCGSKQSGSANNGNTGNSKKTENEASGNPSAGSGGVLRLAFSNGPVNIGNMPQARTIEEVIVGGAALETLTRFDSSGNFVPWLAEKWEQDVEGKAITYTLQQGVKFHDGTDFNAEAVKWNLDQLLAVEKREFSNLASAEVIDEHTVKLNLKSWDSTMIETVTNFLWIMSPTSFEKLGKDAFSKQPVGTGPFVMDSFEQDVVIKYKKNEEYWQAGKPYLDGLEFHIIKDPMIASATFQTGDVDGLLLAPSNTVRELEKEAVIVRLESGLGAGASGFITDSANPKSPFADVRVRKAMGHAIDSEAITKSLFGDTVLNTNQWGLSTSWSYNPEVEGQPYNPEKAKQLLEEAGYPNGFKTKLIGGSGDSDRLTAVQAYLKEVGIDAQIEMVEFGKYKDLTGAEANWEGIITYNFRGDADLALYMSRNFAPGGPLYANNVYQPEDVTRLLQEARTAPDQDTKIKISHELQKLAYDEYALAYPQYVTTSPAIFKPYVKDTGINETYMTFFRPEDAKIEK
ncbi:ABC transporter substrate-binding protein [Paenibacillus sp. FSL W8-0186]|uniref:ABC transporter substrate-binding protein n=1 Tax=Paenibacillus sp. FSL W8-0186 TaxID=2921709 RepID=UPI0030D27A79